jgi:DNA polymerase I-like protein with 3'-5' exonuclease and polymerase domains
MILENVQSIESLIRGKEIYVCPILRSPSHHPKLNDVIALYLAVDDVGYIIPIDHPEGINVDKNILQELLDLAGKIFVFDKKEYLYFFKGKNVYDLHFGQPQSEHNLERPSESEYVTWLRHRYRSYPELNKLVPLNILLKDYDKEYETIRQMVKKFNPDESYEFYNNIAVPVFYLIEQHGLRVTYKEFVELFKPYDPDLNIQDNITFTSYKMYNITSRPTNAFNSVNFAAIPKKPEYRKCFLPQNDLFVEFDFDGYHLRLLAEQVGFELTSESAHTQLARMYFKKEDITPEEYTQAKQINFQAVYGNTPEEHKDFKLFKLIENWTQDLWKEFSTNGYVNAPISLKRFTTDIEGMYPKKLLNYIIQSMETSRNIKVLKNALEYLQNKDTKIALYVYDSVLIDFKKQDGIETLQQLESILSENNRFPVKVKSNLGIPL